MNFKVIAQTPDLHQYWALLSDDAKPGDLRLYTWSHRIPIEMEYLTYLCLVEDLEYQEANDICQELLERGIGIKEKTFRQVAKMLPDIRIGIHVRSRPNGTNP